MHHRIWSAQSSTGRAGLSALGGATGSVCSLPRLRGRGREGAITRGASHGPLSTSPPQAGERAHRVCSSLSRFPILRLKFQTAKAPPARLGGGGRPLSVFCSPKKRGGAERRQALVRKRRTRWLASRSSRSSDRRRSPASDVGRRAFRRSAAASFLRRRAALSAARFKRCRQPAPGRGSLCPRAEPRRRPGAGCEPAARAPHQHEARNCRAPAAGSKDLISGPASGLLRHQDASR